MIDSSSLLEGPRPTVSSVLPPTLRSRDLRTERLGNGLRVMLLPSRQARLVSTCLWYRAGSRDELPGQGGVAHFLEHMMFKGSERFGPGEVDRRTQEMGGTNNAFTGHDATAYVFQLAADRWTESLVLEADRMAGLALAPEQVEAERRVILEEISLYEDDPWDVLQEAVQAAFYGDHPYGRPVLGTREELEATGAEELAAFHPRFYRPDNAVLVVAGDFGDAGRALEAVEAAFGAVRASPGGPEAPAVGASDGVPTRGPGRPVRFERTRGETARLILALPAPAAAEPDFPAVRLLLALVGNGRRSRLWRALVDEGQLCSWVAADVSEGIDPGTLTVTTELLPGSEPAMVEEVLAGALAELAAGRFDDREVERARRVVFADFLFGLERVSQQALLVGSEAILFEPGRLEDQVEALVELDRTAVAAAAHRWLRPERSSVLGWSLPARADGEAA